MRLARPLEVVLLAAILAVLVITGCAGEQSAEGPTTEELQRTIEDLDGRISELESQVQDVQELEDRLEDACQQI